MAGDTGDSTAEFDEIDREWTSTTLQDPETRVVDVSGEISESDSDLDSDLADAQDIAAKLRNDS